MRQYLLLTAAVIVICFLSACKAKRCEETARGNCICTMQYDPVCGCNEKTYGNSCEAECHGIKKYTKGECAK